MNSRLGASPISSSQRFATPSPHRTGVPISDRFSIRSTSAPPRAAYFAAVLPVGPAPTTRTSTSRSIRPCPIPRSLLSLLGASFGFLTPHGACPHDTYGGPCLPTLYVFIRARSEEHTSELQSLAYLVCRLLLEKKKNTVSSAITPV